MAERAAHLLDQVLPRVPFRQCVLSFPWPLRVMFAARPNFRHFDSGSSPLNA